MSTSETRIPAPPDLSLGPVMPIAVGQVFRLTCNTCTPPKLKYFVIAMVEPLRCFLINSRPTQFQASTPERLGSLAPILRAQHQFLGHDSYVACTDLFAEYTVEEIEAAVDADGSVFLGELSAEGRAAVARALSNNRMLPRRHLPALQAAWPDPAGDALRERDASNLVNDTPA